MKNSAVGAMLFLVMCAATAVNAQSNPLNLGNVTPGLVSRELLELKHCQPLNVRKQHDLSGYYG
jgi:hypothetical protein